MFMRITAATLGLSLMATPLWAAPEDYKFELVNPLKETEHAMTATIRLIDKRTGQKVRDAEVREVHTEIGSQKDAAATRTKRVELKNDGDGNYQYIHFGSFRRGKTIDVEAIVPGEQHPIHGKVLVTR